MANNGEDKVNIPAFIDEQFSIKNINESLVEIVEQEMRSQGLDPLNKDDVKFFWRQKGIES